MRKFILFSLSCIVYSICTTAYAREPYKTKQEFSIRWGYLDSEDDFDFFDWNNDYIYSSAKAYTPLNRYNNGKYYYDDKFYTQAITISYTNEINRWLALSINASYSGVFQNERESDGDKIIDKYRKHRIAIFPMARFTYFNRPMIRLYSAAGFGFGMIKEGWSNNGRDKTDNSIDGQLTFFGVSVGKKFFASWELGYGAMGYLIMAGGYRF
jgi:hypothetical protein